MTRALPKLLRPELDQLTEAGFTPLRQSGSHVTWGHADGRRITIPSCPVDRPRTMANFRANVRRVLSGGRVVRAGHGGRR